MGEGPLTGIRVLVADDYNSVARTIALGLSMDGATADSRKTGFELYDIIEAMDPTAPTYEFILTDNQMPGHTGIECVQLARSRGLMIPIYVASSDSIEAEAMAAGANGFLLKPYDTDDLVGIIKEEVMNKN